MINEIEAEMSVEHVLKDLPDFRPVAYYDKHLDAIRVQIMDCSLWEERLDPIMTVYHANNHLQANGINDIVGFAIKGVRHLLRDMGLPAKDGPVRLADFLDLIFKRYPSQSTKLVVEYYRSLRSPKPEQVDIELAAAA